MAALFAPSARCVLVFALAWAPLAAGCADTCFLKVCNGPNCRCSISTCAEGAGFDTRTGRCRCTLGRLPIGGHCLTQRQADIYCGIGHRWDRGGCVVATCRPGDELDVSSGWCISRAQVNQVATGMGVSVGEGQKLGCPAGQKLVIDGQAAACVPLSETCARDEQWTGQACAKVAPCPTGSTWDAARGQCVQYAQGSAGGGLTVNVVQWAFANYGPDGGNGTPSFCAGFSKKPWSFGVNEGSSAWVRVAVMLSFPGGEIAKGVIQTTSAFAASGNPVPPKGGADVDTAAKVIFGPLVEGGGRAGSATASTTVRCLVANAGRPQSVPATGGL